MGNNTIGSKLAKLSVIRVPLLDGEGSRKSSLLCSFIHSISMYQVPR